MGPLRTCDGRAYWNMAVNLAAGNGLSISDPIVAEVNCRLPYGPSHHYSPLLPIIEAGGIRVLGESVATLAVVTLTLSVWMVFVVYLVTRDLFGEEAGRYAGAFASLDWATTMWGTFGGYSENLVAITIAVTLWAILRSLTDPRFIIIAGIFAGLGYLSKGSTGWFFLVAGMGGLGWRIAHHGLRGAFNRFYVVAILIFGGIFAAWSARNLSLFWDGTPGHLLSAWTTSEGTHHAMIQAFQNPDKLLLGMAAKFLVLAPLVLIPMIPLFPRMRESLRHWREEFTSGIVLAAALIFFIGWFLATALWIVEELRVWWGDAVRYVSVANIPLVWLALDKHGPMPRRAIWAGVFVLEIMLLVAGPELVKNGNLLGPR